MSSEEDMTDCLKELMEIDPEAYNLFMEIRKDSARTNAFLGKLQQDMTNLHKELIDMKNIAEQTNKA